MADPLARFVPTSETLARSLLDRLIDLDPDLATDPPRTIGEQMRELRERLRHDLETLLNTRRCPSTPPAGLADGLSDSLLFYGVDGFFSTGLVTDEQRNDFALTLERRIRTCEPRLEQVKVSALPHRHPAERSLRLRIEASYQMQRGLPPIAFETAVDPTTQRLHVEAAHG